MAHWLIKSEPSVYSWDQFVKDKKTSWTGVRNAQAAINLKAMKPGDLCFFYHSNEGKEIVGIARVVREAYPDPTTKEDFSAVDLEPVGPLPRPVTLAELRADRVCGKMMMFRHPRLSVIPVTKAEFEAVLALAKRAP